MANACTALLANAQGYQMNVTRPLFLIRTDMNTTEAISRLREMQSQIIHGSNIFGDIADRIIALESDRDKALRVAEEAREEVKELIERLAIDCGLDEDEKAELEDLRGLVDEMAGLLVSFNADKIGREDDCDCKVALGWRQIDEEDGPPFVQRIYEMKRYAQDFGDKAHDLLEKHTALKAGRV